MKLDKNLKLILILILLILSTFSIYKAFLAAQILSYDFHLSPAELLSDGINHYKYVLDGKHDYGPDDKLKWAQNGEYAQGLYVLYIPFTWIEWSNAKLIWSILNILIAILLPLLICRNTKLDLFQTLFITSIFLMSTMVRLNIGYGQQTLLIFFFLILPFIYNSRIIYFLGGVSYFKYNVGYALFLYLFSKKKYLNLSISVLPVIIGWIAYSYLTDSNYISNFFDPLKVIIYWQSTGNYPVTIFSLFFNIFENLSFFSYLIPIVLSFYVIYKYKDVNDNLLKISIICLVILAFFPHQLHDYIFLLPLFVYSCKNFNYFFAKLNLVFIFYFFFFLRILSFIYGIQPWEFPQGIFGYFNNFFTIIFLLINLKYAKK